MMKIIEQSTKENESIVFENNVKFFVSSHSVGDKTISRQIRVKNEITGWAIEYSSNDYFRVREKTTEGYNSGVCHFDEEDEDQTTFNEVYNFILKLTGLHDVSDMKKHLGFI